MKLLVVRSALGYSVLLAHLQACLIWSDAPVRQCGAIAMLQVGALATAFFRWVI